MPDLHHKMLFTTLWHTGARINGAFALAQENFSLAPPYPYVQLATLKPRGKKAARGPGRAPSGMVPHRLVPLSDPQYEAQLEMMFSHAEVPLGRRNLETGQAENVRLWTVTYRTVRTWLNEAINAAAGDGVTFSVPVARITMTSI